MVRGIGPETFRSARKQTVFLSHELVPGQPNGRERNEDKAGGFTHGPRAFNAEQIAPSCFHQCERVCQKVVITRNFEWFRSAVKPLMQCIDDNLPPRENERKFHKFIWRERGEPGFWGVTANHDAPPVRQRERQGIVFGSLDRFKQNADVQTFFIETAANIVAIGGIKLKFRLPDAEC